MITGAGVVAGKENRYDYTALQLKLNRTPYQIAPVMMK